MHLRSLYTSQSCRGEEKKLVSTKTNIETSQRQKHIINKSALSKCKKTMILIIRLRNARKTQYKLMDSPTLILQSMEEESNR